MAKIILFTPKHELDSRKNLADFIEMCRDRLTVFGEGLNWESNAWPGVANFTVIGAPARGYAKAQLLAEELMQFAKAYLRYQQGHTPTKLKNELKALRCIEKALLQVYGRADITLVDLQVMDVAAEVAREYKATAYQAGIQLVKLVEFLNDSGIIQRRITWRSPFSKPREIDRTDTEGKQRRAAKMPSEHCLEYMAEMFANDLKSPRDRFTTSIFGLLMCAPSRIAEVQDLPLDCIHREIDGKGVERIGLRFYAGKGYGYDIKWIPSIFKEVAQEAVRRLTALSEPGRKIAQWYEENPEKFYRHEDCPDVGEHDPLDDEQAARALGLKSSKSLRNFFARYEPFRVLKSKGEPLTLAFLNEYCHSQLPATWPWMRPDLGIKFSQALCCFRAHELRPDLTTSPVMIWTPGKASFTVDLNVVIGQERNIWKRHGYKNPDGSDISMTSHQVRHFLNTAAQRGDLGQLDIAKWSGRANIRQNAVYNHMTDYEFVTAARQAGIGALEKIRVNAPVTFEDLQAVGEGVAHVTEFGYCVHDFSMVPCQRHRDCLNCSEQVCVKGDDVKLQRLLKLRGQIQSQLRNAEMAAGEGVYGADRWTQHQLKTHQRLNALIELLESPQTPPGAVIWLSNDQEHSPLKRAVNARATSQIQDNSALQDMAGVRALLGV